jgi:mono/diheme cytochrome c family protein
MQHSSGFAPAAFVIASLVFFAIVILRGQALDPAKPFAVHHPTTRPASIASTGSESSMLYSRYCAVCHGVDGRGDGSGASVLEPRPRDFRLGKYRLISTTNGIPSKQDLFRTIRNGMPGTSMPAWRHLSDQQVDALADYIFGFTREGIRQQLTAKKVKPAVLESILKSKTTPGDPVVIAPEPRVTPAELEKGRALFEANCAKCHNSDGTGKQDPTWKTDEGFAISSRNFTAKMFKGGSRSADLYTRISTGLTGTPMPSFGSFPPDDLWRLVHYIQSFPPPAKLPAQSDAVLVRIEARRFAWNFRHAGKDNLLDTADDVVTNGVLHVPAGKTVNYQLVSRDVAHCFWVPSQRIKQPIAQGVVTTGSLRIDKPGEYGIGCAAECGVGRDVMTATLIVEFPANFEAFLTQ